VADADGSAPHQLTHGVGNYQSDPSWAPNGRVIAFESDKRIWTIDFDGANLRRVTKDEPVYRNPSWSRDGNWIYFGKDGSTGTTIWRVSIADGREQQMTGGPGWIASETWDGKDLVYIPMLDRRGSPVLIAAIDGGSPRKLIDCAFGFSVGAKGVYYYSCRPGGIPVPLTPDKSAEVRLVDPDTGRDRSIASLPEVGDGLFFGPRVSPDGTTFLFFEIRQSGTGFEAD
jgi:Tol biopolymer transport system component